MEQVPVDVEQGAGRPSRSTTRWRGQIFSNMVVRAAIARPPYSAAALMRRRGRRCGARPIRRRRSGRTSWPARPVDRRELALLRARPSSRSQVCDDAAQQQAGQDRDRVAHAFGVVELDLRRLAAAHDVQQAGPLTRFGTASTSAMRLRRLDEGHIGAVGERRVGALDRLVEADHGARIGAGDDAEVLRAAGGGGGADLGDEVLAAHQLLVVEMAALLGEHLVLDMDGGDAGALELLHGAEDVELVAEAGVAVADQRDRDRVAMREALPTISVMVIRP